MIIFPRGIKISETERKCLIHIVSEPEQWLRDTINEKARLRKNALINEWRPKLLADASVTDLPASDEELCALIMARDDYKTRLQQDAAEDPPVALTKHATAKFKGTPRHSTVTLFPSGIDLAATDIACILAYVQDLENWVIGALLGQINRGQKKMLRQYQPVLMADPSVDTVPASIDGIVSLITNRTDYKSLPQQAGAVTG